MPAAAANKPKPNQRVRQPVQIEQIGVEDWAGGKGTLKSLVLGGPDSGKTRWSSAFPRPLYLACEPTVAASIASRKISYAGGIGAPHIVRINTKDRPSDALFDVLDNLAEQPRKTAPGTLPRYQTAILDTLDGLQYLLKDEWAAREGVSMFTGRDAWGFLEGKLNLILSRLMNLDMNVIVLCHVKDREVEEQVGDSTQKRNVYEPLLQGSIKDTVLNQFDLIGLMKREMIGDQEFRGISFDPTPTYPFLKDHYALEAPGDRRLGRRFWPVQMEDGTKGGGDPDSFEQVNYLSLWSALVGEMDGMSEGGVIEDIPEAGLPSDAGVLPAGTAGGPVGTATPPAKAPAKATVPPKAVAPAPGNGAAPVTAPAATEEPPVVPTPTPGPTMAVTPGSTPGSQETPPTAAATPAAAAPAPAAPDAVAPEAVDPGGAGSDGPAASAPVEAPVTPAVEPETSVPATETPAPTEELSAATPATDVPTHEEGVAAVQETLGGEVVAEGLTADVAPEVARGNGCPICGKDMSGEQADLVQLSRLKHRTLVLPDGTAFYDTGGCCYADYQKLNEEKASKTGLYAPA